MSDKLTDVEKRLLKTVVDHFEAEDRDVRERQIRVCKKLKYYWDGFQRIWWSEVAHDWRNITDQNNDIDASNYDKPINVLRAYLESIIAALSVNIPAVNCAPDDADNPADIATAKAGDKIAELVYKHNDVQLLYVHALFILCTEGMIAAYAYPKESEDYGTYDKPKYEDVEETQTNHYCPTCNNPVTPEETDEFQPESTIATCETCESLISPEERTETFTIKRQVGVTKEPKSRICMEVYGQLYVKIAQYAMKQADTPYLIFSYETHYANVVERYEELRDKLRSGSTDASDSIGQWARNSVQYLNSDPVNNVTVRNCWLRPAAFNILTKAETELLKKKFPHGAKVVVIEDEIADAEDESLDDYWTLTHNPLSDYLLFDPIGNLLTNIQDITNDLISLVIQTIEHGIPQTFADPAVLDFSEYRQQAVAPGMVFPAKPSSGKNLSEAFHEVKTASLSGEVQPFGEKIQELGQLVSGALPSLFGGAAPNSSKTAAQYAMSRAQALQRLQTHWKMLSMWWKNIFGKVIPMFMKEVKEDERFVTKDKTGNWANTYIRLSEMYGKIGSVELESSDQLPITIAQQKDIILQLMESNNPEIMAAIASPDNIPMLAEIIGLNNFEIPGADDRQKQYEEIKVLLETEPLVIPDPLTGQEQQMPSIEVEPLVDNHMIHFTICRDYLVSDAGRAAKANNESGYQNILLHMQQHMNMERVFNQPVPEGQNNNQPQGSSKAVNNGQPEPAIQQ